MKHDGIWIGFAASANAAPSKGWVVGHFETGTAHSSEVEVKLWHYDTQPDYPEKTFEGTEFIVIEGGSLRIEATLEGKQQTVYLDGQQRMFVIFPPGTAKKVFVTHAPAFGTTVRWPSTPEANKIL